MNILWKNFTGHTANRAKMVTEGDTKFVCPQRKEGFFSWEEINVNFSNTHQIELETDISNQNMDPEHRDLRNGWAIICWDLPDTIFSIENFEKEALQSQENLLNNISCAGIQLDFFNCR